MEQPRFTEEEWARLVLLPFVTFHLVACADGAIQQEEATAFVEQLKAAASCPDPVRRELSQTILASDFMALFTEAADPARFDERLREAAGILRRRLGDAGHRAFAGQVVLQALDVALAYERGAGRLTKTPEEEQALARIASGLGLDAADLVRSQETPGC